MPSIYRSMQMGLSVPSESIIDLYDYVVAIGLEGVSGDGVTKKRAPYHVIVT